MHIRALGSRRRLKGEINRPIFIGVRLQCMRQSSAKLQSFVAGGGSKQQTVYVRFIVREHKWNPVLGIALEITLLHDMNALVFMTRSTLNILGC